MATLDFYYEIRLYWTLKSGIKKLIHKSRIYEKPTQKEIGRLAKQYAADDIDVVMEYAFLPFA